jgi:hypothetical protein
MNVPVKEIKKSPPPPPHTQQRQENIYFQKIDKNEQILWDMFEQLQKVLIFII